MNVTPPQLIKRESSNARRAICEWQGGELRTGERTEKLTANYADDRGDGFAHVDGTCRLQQKALPAEPRSCCELIPQDKGVAGADAKHNL
jgi:hypothetical protein|tara:strand:- start:1051 stop:1320 length:270 start_codon:yes stop_codon:yes gene_type:complete